MPTPHRATVTASPWPGIHATQIDSGRHFRRHAHATFGIGWLAQGAQVSASGQGRVEAFAGDLITTNPGEVHDGQPLGGASRRWQMLYFDASAFAQTTGQAAGAIALPRPVVRDRRLALVFRRLLQRVAAWQAGADATVGGDADRLACDEALVAACTLLSVAQPAAADAAARQPSDAMVQVHARLGDDPLQAPSLAALAAMAGLSRFQLLRHFEAAYGLTPHAWLLQRRTEAARQRIACGDALADAAAAAGFADQSHMTRRFAQQFGYTPGDWQKAAAPRSPR